MALFDVVLDWFIDFIANHLSTWIVIFIAMGFCGQMLFNKR